MLLLGSISIGDHLNIVVAGPFKLFGKNYIKGARGPSINIITGGTFKFRAFKYCCRGVTARLFLVGFELRFLCSVVNTFIYLICILLCVASFIICTEETLQHCLKDAPSGLFC